METRAQKISRYISASRAEMQFGPLEAKLHNHTVNEWLDRCRHIPEEYLDECYQMVMDAQTTRSPIIARQLNEQWMILRHRGAGKPRERREKECRFWCSSDGWIIVDHNGDMVRETTKVNLQYTYAKPCSDHRQKGVKMDGKDPMLSGLPRPRIVETSFVSDRKDRKMASTDFKSLGDVAKHIVERIADELPPGEDEVPF